VKKNERRVVPTIKSLAESGFEKVFHNFSEHHQRLQDTSRRIRQRHDYADHDRHGGISGTAPICGQGSVEALYLTETVPSAGWRKSVDGGVLFRVHSNIRCQQVPPSRR
jgi:hypothetical protein